MRADIIERLRKIQRLANGGEGGEAGNAAELLARIARDNGIDLARLDEPGVSKHVARVGTEAWRHTLFCQIVWRRRDDCKIFRDYDPPLRGRQRSRRSNACSLVCSDDFFIEVVVAFEILSHAYERKLKALLPAFLIANDLLNDRNYSPAEQLTSAQRQLSADASALSCVIERTPILRQIEDSQ